MEVISLLFVSVFRDIEPGNRSMAIDVALKILELDEVTVVKKIIPAKRTSPYFGTPCLVRNLQKIPFMQ